MGKVIFLRKVLDDLVHLLALIRIGAGITYVQVGSEEIAEEKSQVLDEFLIRTAALCIDGLEIHCQRDDFGDLVESIGVHLD
jgi:hypothetical protein